MASIDQMDAVRSDASPGCEQPNESTTEQDKASWLRPLPADRPFGECSQRQVQFKAERSANGKFIVGFADGSTTEVTEKSCGASGAFATAYGSNLAGSSPPKVNPVGSTCSRIAAGRVGSKRWRKCSFLRTLVI
jgi:hypothetical protein